MSKPNPFVPAGSLIAQRQRRSRNQFRLAVCAVLTAHALLLLAMLFQGCKSDAPSNTSSENAASEPAAPGAGPAPAALEWRQSSASAAPVAAAGAPRPALPSAAGAPASAAGGDLIYVVKSGDTVQRIAKAHGTTAQAFRAANGLKNDRLLVGMKLKLPAGARMGVAATSPN